MCKKENRRTLSLYCPSASVGQRLGMQEDNQITKTGWQLKDGLSLEAVEVVAEPTLMSWRKKRTLMTHS